MPGAFTLAEKRAELRRELGQRAFVYPKLVGAGKLRQADADRQTAILRAILDEDLAEANLFTGAQP